MKTIKDWLKEKHIFGSEADVMKCLNGEVLDTWKETNYYITENNLKSLCEFIIKEQKNLCSEEYKRFIGRQSETDIITNILQSPEIKWSEDDNN